MGLLPWPPGLLQAALSPLHLAALQSLEVLHVTASVLLVLSDVVDQVADDRGEPEEHGDQHHRISGSPHRQTQIPVLHQQDQRHPNSSCNTNTNLQPEILTGLIQVLHFGHFRLMISCCFKIRCTHTHTALWLADEHTEVWEVRGLTDDFRKRRRVQIQLRHWQLNTNRKTESVENQTICLLINEILQKRLSLFYEWIPSFIRCLLLQD